MTLPNATYAVQNMPTLAKNIVIVTSGTAFGALVKAAVQPPATTRYSVAT